MQKISHVQQNIPAFKGQYKKTERGVPYYHTNSAIKIGGAFAGAAALMSLLELGSNKLLKTMYENMPNQKSIMEAPKSKSSIILGGLFYIAIHLGASAFIDYKRNQKAQETANIVKQLGTKRAIMTNDDIALSNKGRAYYDSNVGAKYGGWLGAGIGALIAIQQLYSNKALRGAKNPKGVLGVAIASSIGTTALVDCLGGWLLGKWSDNIANKDARKHA